MRSLIRGAILLALPASLAACTSCPREGCDALESPVDEDGSTRIAGVIASESDVIRNGCQECPFGSAKIEIWKTAAPVDSSASAKVVVRASAPTATAQADPRYGQPLDAGSYLVCVRPYCTSVVVVEKRTTTVHVQLFFGPTRFIVFDPGADASREATSFDVGFPLQQ